MIFNRNAVGKELILTAKIPGALWMSRNEHFQLQEPLSKVHSYTHLAASGLMILQETYICSVNLIVSNKFSLKSGRIQPAFRAPALPMITTHGSLGHQ